MHNALYLFGIAIMHVRFNFSFLTIRLKALKQFLNMDEGFLLKETEKNILSASKLRLPRACFNFLYI